MTVVDGVARELEAGHAALVKGEWEEASFHFRAALDREESPVGWEGLGWAAWWLADEDTTFDARERAFRGFREAGDEIGAGRVATWLAADFREYRGDAAVGRGWLGRAHRLLDPHDPCEEHGWLALTDADFALNVDGDLGQVIERASAAATLGRRLSSPDLEAVGLALEGVAMVGLGQLEEGMRRLDEGSAIAIGEDLSLPISCGWTLCCLVNVCDRVGDFERASEWCRAMRRFSERWGGRQLLGVCRTSYGRILATRGAWNEAESELTAAIEDFEASRPGLAASGFVRLGELRARQGRLDEARELFERAGPAGLVGLGTLALEQGDTVGAVEIAERALRRIPEAANLERLPALELLARARATRGEAGAAERALQALEQAAEPYPTPYVRGRIHATGATVASGDGDEELARKRFEDAIDCFEESSAPYEAALARAGLAATLRALGRTAESEAATAAAAKALEDLGAPGNAQAARRAFGTTTVTGPGGELTARELEVLRLVAQGLSDAEVAERLVVSSHTVHRHVANIRTKLGLRSRAAAVAYATREGLI